MSRCIALLTLGLQLLEKYKNWSNCQASNPSTQPLAFLRAKVDDVPAQGPLRHDLIPATVGIYVQLEYIHVDILPA